MFPYQQLDWDVSEIWEDIKRRSESEGRSIWEYQDEFFSRLRNTLNTVVAWWNFWCKSTKSSDILIYKQTPTGEKKDWIKLVQRDDYTTFQDFSRDRISTSENVRIPMREDIEKLRWEWELDKKWFSKWTKYIFDDGDNGVGIFYLGDNWCVEIWDKSQTSHAKLKFIWIDFDTNWESRGLNQEKKKY